MATEIWVDVKPPAWGPDTIATLPDGTKISMSNACNRCGYSLEWCQDERPTVSTGRGVKEVTLSTSSK